MARLRKALIRLCQRISSLFKLTAGGYAPEKGALCSLYKLCGHGLDAGREREGNALNQRDMVLRSVLANYPEGEAAE